MNEKEIQCFGTQADQGELRKADNKGEQKTAHLPERIIVPNRMNNVSENRR